MLVMSAMRNVGDQYMPISRLFVVCVWSTGWENEYVGFSELLEYKPAQSDASPIADSGRPSCVTTESNHRCL